jgi:putative ABC transport system substrate-binding protein
MRRRDVIAGLFVAAATRRARAQQTGKVYRIAIVRPAGPLAEMTETGGLRSFRALFEELRRLGYVEGQNLVVERFSGEGRMEYYPELARDVVRLNPDLIWASTPFLLLAFKAATATIPITAFTADPVAYGVVPNIARPGGNVTGVTTDAGSEIWGKRLELLKQVVPRASKVGYLYTRAGWESPQGAARGSSEAGDLFHRLAARRPLRGARISPRVRGNRASRIRRAPCEP